MAEAAAPTTESSSSAGKSSAVLGLIFAAINLVVVGGGAYLVYISTIGYVPKVTSEFELNKELIEFRKGLQARPVMYRFEPFSVNLKGIPRRMMRVEVNLEMLDAEGFEEVIGLGAQASDAILRILNTKSFEEIETVQGKLHLKSEIAESVNSFLSRGVVKNVYFSDFVIQ